MRTSGILVIIFFTLTKLTTAQELKECGTPEKLAWFNELKLKNQMYTGNTRGGQPVIIPYQIHLFQSSSGFSNLTLQEIYDEIDSLNTLYANAGLVFVECIAPQIINDDYYFNFDYTLHDADVLNNFYTADLVNMYFANTVTSSNGSSLCGYSQFPPSEDYVVLAANCATNGSTLAHELGHLFGLPHTHGGSPDELVDGSNCAFEGDYICDTPADPTLSNSVVDINCTYTGTATDANGMFYTPDPQNIMSYSRKECRNYFSPMQYDVIYNTYLDYRSYLFCSALVSAGKNSQSKSITLFPNPGNNSLYLSTDESFKSSLLKISNSKGQLIYETYIVQKNTEIITTDWPSGIYFMNVINSSGLQQNSKWMKQ